jgi:hypothetical protein
MGKGKERRVREGGKEATVDPPVSQPRGQRFLSLFLFGLMNELQLLNLEGMAMLLLLSFVFFKKSKKKKKITHGDEKTYIYT